jgi:hypothetical protein
MFNFRKKSEKSEKEKEEKERRKREKRERKERLKGMDTSTLSTEEMARLDEMRKTLKGIEKAKKAEHITQEDNAENTNYDSGASGSSETTWSMSSGAGGSLTRAGLGAPPRPPSRGILKGHNYNVARSVSSELDDANILLKNTQANEMLLYENLLRAGKSPKSPLSPAKESLISPGESADRDLAFEHIVATKVRAHKDHVSPVSPTKVSMLHLGASDAPKRPSSMTKPMSSAELRLLVSGESVGVNLRPLSSDFSIELPGEKEVGEELVKVVTLDKRVGRGSVAKGAEGGSFGVGLSTGHLKRTGRGKKLAGSEEQVVLVESESIGKGVGAGLIPGDRLLEVNGVKCVGMKLETVAEIVRKVEESGEEKMTLKVRKFKSSFPCHVSLPKCRRGGRFISLIFKLITLQVLERNS